MDLIGFDPRGALRSALLDPQLLRLNGGIFLLHFMQMAMFVVVPPLLTEAGAVKKG